MLSHKKGYNMGITTGREGGAMDSTERTEELRRAIAELPAGSITKKRVHGREYSYLRWSENGKRRERYLTEPEAALLQTEIAKRKELEAELCSLGASVRRRGDAASAGGKPSAPFKTSVLLDDELLDFCEGVRDWRSREALASLMLYLEEPPAGKVFVLYGLRRTGKTTLIRQAILAMGDAERSRAAFIQVNASNTLGQLNQDLRRLMAGGIKYVFIDEVTALEDFIEGAALLSDIFACCGMHIVLSGTDSLGFSIAEDEQLYDRCKLLHTTYIPYREFSRVLGIEGIDEYIRYGGTMSLGGADYAANSPFSSSAGVDKYVDTAIASNIQHSLARYQYGGHFRALQDLYDAGELTSAINRVVEDMNHRFALEVLERDFKSHDLALSANNLRRERSEELNVLDRVDVAEVTGHLRELLEIRNREERSVALCEAHAVQIKEYLDLLDLTLDVPVRFLPDVSREENRTVITQPGLRYAQVEALIDSLLSDQEFANLSLVQRNVVTGRMRSEVMGRMLEDIILLETTISRPSSEVFTLRFARGEYDMVIFDPKAASCEVFEIKHSDKVVAAQRRHLLDQEKRAMTEHRYGPITGTYVLYRGPADYVDGVQYVNVEEYLS